MIAKTKANGTTKTKPAKPYALFPLTANGNGQWSKKIRGRVFYFGAWSDPEAAEKLYNQQAADLFAGRQPRDLAAGDELTVGQLCDQFLSNKKRKANAGELKSKTYKEYEFATDLIVEAFGKSRRVDDIRVEDFDSLYDTLATKYPSAVSRKNRITIIKVVFNFAFETGLVETPFRFGTLFKKPADDVLRKERNAKAKKEYSRDEILSLLDVAPTQVRAMILLAINCGFGNRDCGLLRVDAVDLAGGWIRFPRPKTGKARRAKLWPETVDALRVVLSQRGRRQPHNVEDRDLVFLTRKNFRWSKDNSNADPLAREFKKLCVEVGIYKGGVGFYALRHTFASVAMKSKDLRAVGVVLGHIEAANEVGAIYAPDATVDDEAVADVCTFVRNWLYGSTAADQPATLSIAG